ncbi:response regulator transcription factor [Mesorhizobium mediterraneum]|uniref:response regulator transcription factor n=1 Tax=Mesorhizobium mediterraneum TaxID=43617 RepID=UPI001786E530
MTGQELRSGHDLQFHLALGPGAQAVTKEKPSLPSSPAAQESAVLIVEDDPMIREALRRLLGTVGLRAQTFGSASELMQSAFPDAPSCLVLDIRLPGRSGLDLQVELAKAGVRIPIVFMTGHGDIPMSVQAMKAGAVDFLTKPFRDQEMLDAVAAAIEGDRARRIDEEETSRLRALFESLSAREREVMALATAGLMNKQIAGELGLSEITVKIHRGHAMKKMQARTLADLVRMAETLGIHRAKR